MLFHRNLLLYLVLTLCMTSHSALVSLPVNLPTSSVFLATCLLTSGGQAATSFESPENSILPSGGDEGVQPPLTEVDSELTTASTSPSSVAAPLPSLVMVRELRNVTKEVGEGVRLRCEVKGTPPPREIIWFRNEAPMMEEPGRVRIKKVIGKNSGYSVLRLRPLESLDTGLYKCEASNTIDTIRSNTMTLKVEIGSGSRNQRLNDDADYIHVPDTFDDPFESFNSVGQVEGLPSHIEFQGRGPDHFSQVRPREKLSPSSSGLPSLKPDENSGKCQKYTGSACAAVLGNNYIFISADQDYIEKQLTSTFAVIGTSPDMSARCAEYAIPAICHSTFPLCDLRTKKPRKLCRHECDVLEHDICKTELAIAKSHPMISHQIHFPECTELPPIGTRESHNCVRLDIPNIGQLIQPHSCYTGSGQTYRGTHSMTRSGHTCRPWSEQLELEPVPKYPELVGGHNYCRNPGGEEEGGLAEPWCFTDDPSRPKETCGIPACTNFSVWLYIVLPASVALVLCALLVALCCLRKANKKPSSLATGSPRSFINPGGSSSNHNYSEMEMNHLLPAPQTKPRVVQAREFPISAVRFVQEMGEASFGKVYRGELGGLVGGLTSMVAVKTLKPGANQQTREAFQRESELMADLRHPNIICLLGVVTKDEPRCLIFEWPGMGDLHEYLLSHSPKSELALSSVHSSSGSERIVDHGDMSYLAMQIASGMEYLVQHQYIHRDLAARNILMGPNLNVKISDLGLSRDKYAADYYRMQSKSLVPLRWMAPESIFFGKFCHESDVWGYGVLLWEIYSYGLQPYYGYSNQEVIEMLRSRQLLPCPEECPSRMYAFMVECWHEIPARRPSFTEISARLRQWEGMSCGYQSTHSNSQCGQSDHSNSQHSSTGPSNNTGSTNLSQQPGYAHPYSVQVNQAGHHLLVSQNRTYSNMYTGSTPGSSLQMV